MLRLLLAGFTAFIGLASFAQVDDSDLLGPEEAFRIAETRAEAGRILLEWQIAEGYYLYRDKLRFRVAEGTATAGDPVLPPGEIKDDEFFGRLETYRGRLQVALPLLGGTPGETLSLEVTSQGCADLGICYPPRTETLNLTLAAAAKPATEAISTLSGLSSEVTGGDAGDDFLEPDKAFQLTVTAAGPSELLASWRIADGYYLYRDKFRFTLKDPSGATLGAARLPPGVVKADPLFGRVEVYHEGLDALVPVARGTDTASVELEVGYQGCAEAGLCYPPIAKVFEVVLPPLGGASPAPPVQADGVASTEPISEQDRLAALLSKDRWVAVIAFFGFGLLLALTPCVFPMIPILSGIIAGQGSGITTRKAFVLSVVYVLAMSVTYTIAGIIAGKFGHNLQAALQNPWMLTTFSLVFVLLAFSMFGFYDLQLPASWQSRLAEVSNRQQGGTLMGVAVMGFLSALIVGPCVAPPLAGALIYIGQTGDPWLGGLALFSLSLGMGAPLVAVGTLEGKYLPRAGGWMNAVKAVFGVLMLGVAVFLLERVLPGPLILLLWAGLLIVSAIYMGALEPLGLDASGFRKLWKGVGLVMLVYGVVLVIGAAGGGSNPFRPLRGVALAGGAADTGDRASHGLDFEPVKGLAGLETGLAVANGRPVMLDFYADWCVSCKELERYTFSAPAVKKLLSDTSLLQADVTDNDAEDQALLKAFGLYGPPAVLFFDSEGKERRGYRLVGYMAAEPFLSHAAKAIAP